MSEPNFGKWLLAKRQELGLKGIQLEERTGITRQYISQMETGVKSSKKNKFIQPSEEVVEKLARALGVPINEARHAAGYAPVGQLQRPEGERLLEYFNALPAAQRAMLLTTAKALYDEYQIENTKQAA